MALTTVQMKRLCELLTDSDKSQEEIAHDLGFSSDATFRYHLREMGLRINRVTVRTLEPIRQPAEVAELSPALTGAAA